MLPKYKNTSKRYKTLRMFLYLLVTMQVKDFET